MLRCLPNPFRRTRRWYSRQKIAPFLKSVRALEESRQEHDERAPSDHQFLDDQSKSHPLKRQSDYNIVWRRKWCKTFTKNGVCVEDACNELLMYNPPWVEVAQICEGVGLRSNNFFKGMITAFGFQWIRSRYLGSCSECFNAELQHSAVESESWSDASSRGKPWRLMNMTLKTREQPLLKCGYLIHLFFWPLSRLKTLSWNACRVRSWDNLNEYLRP